MKNEEKTFWIECGSNLIPRKYKRDGHVNHLATEGAGRPIEREF